MPTGIPKDFYAFWIPMLISESFYCACAMYRGLRGYRRGQNMLQNGKQLINILVRDSLYYFFMCGTTFSQASRLEADRTLLARIFATYLTNAVIFLTSPVRLYHRHLDSLAHHPARAQRSKSRSGSPSPSHASCQVGCA